MGRRGLVFNRRDGYRRLYLLERSLHMKADSSSINAVNFFIGSYDEALTVATCVSNEDCSPAKIHG